MRILYITDYLPYPPVTGDLIRNYNLVRRIAARHEVSVVGFQDPTQPDGRQPLSEFCQRVEAIALPHRSKPVRILRMLGFQARGIPFELEFLGSDALSECIGELSKSEEFDIVQIEHSRMAPYVEALPPGSRARRVLMFHNLAASQFGRISSILSRPLDRLRTRIYSRLLRDWEPRVARRFDLCLTVSDVDRQALLRANPALPIESVPNGVDTQAYQPLPAATGPLRLLLTGSMSYRPNADGAIWFCKHVLPILRQAEPGIGVSIVGLNPPPEVLALAADDVRVLGRVPDLVPYYRECAIALVPVRAGGGTRLKVLEAMALGRPVVSTTVGAEGLRVLDGEHLLIADQPQQMAQAVIRLLEEPELNRRIIRNARQLVVSEYNWDAIAGRLMSIYASLIAEPGMHPVSGPSMQNGAA